MTPLRRLPSARVLLAVLAPALALAMLRAVPLAGDVEASAPSAKPAPKPAPAANPAAPDPAGGINQREALGLPPFPVRVSPDGRHLLDDRGRPFFWLADTAWELFHRPTKEEADLYLKNRADKGFTVIQAVVLAELDGLDTPTPDGLKPFTDNDPAKPEAAYFDRVAGIIDAANKLGLVVAVLPTWGDKWSKKWGVGPEVFTPGNARTYGRFLGERLKWKSIVWVLGGDRPVESAGHLAIIRAMALGLHEGDGGTHLHTFHPSGGRSSAEWLHAEPWLDFNLLQSGHDFDRDNWQRVGLDHARRPAKPIIDGEPGYEDHPAGFKKERGYLGEHDVRKAAYWALFAGAAGHTYGCHPVWQFWQEGREPKTFPRRSWKEALDLPGAGQMRHVRTLIGSRPQLDRVPAPELVVEPGTGPDHVEACRGKDGTWAMVYLPSGKPAVLDVSGLKGGTLTVTWYDPRTGKAHVAGTVKREGRPTFTPPKDPGPDWVLVLDDASADRKPPGE